MVTVEVVGRVLAIGLLGTAALTDLVHRRIYRRWSAAALASGLVLALLAGQWSHLLVALALFTATYFLWARGGVVGGDVWLAAYLGLV
jgi:Flp pilus assembly protein protease CpaA